MIREKIFITLRLQYLLNTEKQFIINIEFSHSINYFVKVSDHTEIQSINSMKYHSIYHNETACVVDTASCGLYIIIK